MSFPPPKKHGTARPKTYGKAVKAQLSGLFGRNLWAEAESAGVTRKEQKGDGEKTRRKRPQDDAEAADCAGSPVPVLVDDVDEEDALAGIEAGVGGLRIQDEKKERPPTEIPATPEQPRPVADAAAVDSDCESVASDKENVSTAPSPSEDKDDAFPPQPDAATPVKEKSPRGVLSERTLLEYDIPKESPPRKRGLRKRISAASAGVGSPLRNAVASPAKPDATEPDAGIKVWEDPASPVKAKKRVVPQRVDENQPVEIPATPEQLKPTKRIAPTRVSDVSTASTIYEDANETPATPPTADSSGLSTHPSLDTTTTSIDPLTDLLQLCTIPEVLDFSTHIASLLESSHIRKLGEASYSEVFVQTPARATPLSPPATILKLIPFGAPEQCELSQITQEIQITRAMSQLRGYIGFQGAYIVRGATPEPLLAAWDAFDASRGSENERPDFYEPAQLFAIICLDHGGTDLEHFALGGWEEAAAVFWQTAAALARGERRHNFEHRDLHFGNIVITRTDTPAEELLAALTITDAETPLGAPRTNLHVALIDYTLSRAELADGRVEYARLDDPALFAGRGDYQFDIYRFMRAHLASGDVDPDEEWIEWNVYAPRTNVFWLHYLCLVLLNRMGLVRPGTGRTRRRGGGAPEKEERVERERAWYRNLETVARLIDPRKKRFGGRVVGSAGDLCEWARGEGVEIEL